MTVRGLLPLVFARRPATFARLAATAGATEDVNAKDMTCTTMDVSGVTLTAAPCGGLV